MSKKRVLKSLEDRFCFERRFSHSGNGPVAGIDEAGRGPLAGPVVAAAVIIKEPEFSERIDDSKKLTEKRREKAFFEILNRCGEEIGYASVQGTDILNILRATLRAMERAVKELKTVPGYLLIDGKMDVDLPQPRTCIIRGEEHSLSIACASIIAKVFRDKIMLEEDRKFPKYGFARHKGYGTSEHLANIRKHGLSPIHRKTFGPFGPLANTYRNGPGF